jgi:precorrin-4 methylase
MGLRAHISAIVSAIPLPCNSSQQITVNICAGPSAFQAPSVTMRRQWHEPDTSAQVIVGRTKPVIPYSNETEANSVIELLVWHLLSINRR